jgi:amino-acid N-acetyltransferase
MSVTIRKAKVEELSKMLQLLERAELPGDGVAEHLSNFLVAEDENDLVGTAGLEVYERVGLLRSLAVNPGIRGKGLGARLVESILALAREQDLETVYLLTTTADTYFPKFGFEKISRDELDPRLSASEELRGACPQTAICMKLSLRKS